MDSHLNYTSVPPSLCCALKCTLGFGATFGGIFGFGRVFGFSPFLIRIGFGFNSGRNGTAVWISVATRSTLFLSEIGETILFSVEYGKK